ANRFIEAEMHLLQLRRQKEDPQLAAQAVEALARLMARKGLMEDAAYYYRILGSDFAHVILRDGKTGLEWFRDLATDKRFLPYLDATLSTPSSGRLQLIDLPGGVSFNLPSWAYESQGELLPYLAQQRLVWVLGQGAPGQNQTVFQLKVLDKDTNQERWS